MWIGNWLPLVDRVEDPFLPHGSAVVDGSTSGALMSCFWDFVASSRSPSAVIHAHIGQFGIRLSGALATDPAVGPEVLRLSERRFGPV